MSDSHRPTALVTGAARRIGRSIALHLHAMGYDVVAHYHRSTSDAQSLQLELNKRRENSCTLVCADICTSQGVAGLVSELGGTHNYLDVLVNNASGFEATPIESCTHDAFDSMVGSNLRGPYFLVQGLLPLLRVNGASIVNIVDTHVERPLPDFNVYGAAKAGLLSLTRSLAVELAPDIRVNAIAPGAILWPEGGDAYSKAERERAVLNTPLQRMGAPQDIAETVGFLAQGAQFITGQVLVVDGGKGLVT